jgi:cardiolipin synthase
MLAGAVTFLLIALAAVALTVIVLNLSSGEKKITRRIEHAYDVRHEQFHRVMGHLLGPPIADGNRVTDLQNGDEIFPAMLAAIRSARRTITFESYIYWSGQVGQEFAEALSERARAGVACHLLLDWMGSNKMDKEQLRRMEAAGVQIQRYHPPRWYTLSKMNNRTHRKVLVVDGTVGFTGGVGIADQWLGNAQSAGHWRDSHYRLEGPAVAHMQAAFMDNWLKTHSEVLHQEEYFPSLAPMGEMQAQVFKSSAGEGSESARLMYLLSIAAAARSIRIANAYFVPDDLSVATLCEASRRGVRIEIIVPGSVTDEQVVRHASRARWGPLLEAGVAIYVFEPTMFHCKLMIVDDFWVSVGSTNFDSRSFRLNDEANLNVVDEAFAARQLEVFEQDKIRSRRVTLAEWQSRPVSERVRDLAASLLRSQL